MARIRYVLFGSFVASFGSVDFIANYGKDVFPFGFIFMIIFPMIFAYAIQKYRLMEIGLIITRTSIFIAVYSLVLGIPFALAFGLREELTEIFNQHWWIVPLVVSTILATAGPSIYLYFSKRAEDRLLLEQRQYQSTLSKASLGMGRIKNLKRLLDLIVHIVTRTVRIAHCEIYLLHEESNQYILKASKNSKDFNELLSVVPVDSSIVQYLKNIREPIVFEEIKQKIEDYNDQSLASLEQLLNVFDAELVVPSFIDDKLIAFITLGKKKSGKVYNDEDIAVFSILANQSALAIENAQFYEDMKKTNEQLFKAEKMATIGTMADGLSHQINNRLHAIGFIAGDALDSVHLQKSDKLSQGTLELMNEAEHALLRVQDNVRQGGRVVEGLLKYTRKAEEGVTSVDLAELLDAAIEMASFKVNVKELEIIRDFDRNLPKMKGNFTQLQEVLFNIIDNAYDAIVQRKNDLKEENFKGILRVSALHIQNHLEIKLADNGIGVKRENLEKLFTPFFTTKASSEKGTGLGLYVIKQIIEQSHDGKVVFTSEHKKGTEATILLPITTSAES